ncbi:phosphate ABC transporter permease PstA [Vibrio cyclitrophicus]|uniref:phosphate ABC transporter permease PstA n=1 Tax=Vibrio cyclitrophicus TaxID=47951 RepID=UPI0002DB906B|nr:phosphate ABC transporter permease PstA [Vibrio cyclitrophicus]OEE04509.1 phosphate ABC transporter, permease protein PstA [Vibrio cyclitrophicus ZF28]PMG15162.1 phosphate ABC transporter, permease protein PstA [Vibrio cyclitrophicus]
MDKLKSLISWIKSGSPWIWLTGGAVSISMLSVLGLMLLIGWKGLTYFWPAPLYQWQVESKDLSLVVDLDETVSKQDVLIGQLYERKYIPIEQVPQAHDLLSPQNISTGLIQRLNIKVANRELYPADFVSILDVNLLEPTTPSEWAVIERSRGGYFFGKPVGFKTASGTFYSNIDQKLEDGLAFADTLREETSRVVNQEIRNVSWQLENLRLEKRKLELNESVSDDYLKTYTETKLELNRQLDEAELKLEHLRTQLNVESLLVEDMTGEKVEIPLSHILDYWYPNIMSYPEKVGHWGKQVWKFLSENPRDSNSEGGVFPAIFGTVLLVILMSIVVMPLGVVAAIYLHEYAKSNALTRLIRIAVINLAGVPSIVYGVFGLGFFVYTIGGSIDSLFYAERLPAPTFGTPGLLWSALTLAVLTLPVVIVTTEEGLTRIPSSVRHGSLALGATQFETLWRIVLPMASPAIITGLILAIARAAGEVAPLMLVGVVKLASSLPVDSQFPYIHLDRKFMHLGFHIYDVGFQTSNIEAARPLVYATSFLLVTVIVGLNLTAINIRNNLREKYRTLGQD